MPQCVHEALQRNWRQHPLLRLKTLIDFIETFFDWRSFDRQFPTHQLLWYRKMERIVSNKLDDRMQRILRGYKRKMESNTIVLCRRVWSSEKYSEFWKVDAQMRAVVFLTFVNESMLELPTNQEWFISHSVLTFHCHQVHLFELF